VRYPVKYQKMREGSPGRQQRILAGQVAGWAEQAIMRVFRGVAGRLVWRRFRAAIRMTDRDAAEQYCKVRRPGFSITEGSHTGRNQPDHQDKRSEQHA
jgi:hypothetical protein